MVTIVEAIALMLGFASLVVAVIAVAHQQKK